MPKMGEDHLLLSSTHPDTSPPAGGADPADGQVATWSDALKAWTALDPTPGGVTVHGLLTGLDVDDHAQYALADKSRPATWVEADDLWPRQIQDMSGRHHHDLQFLSNDDHPIYILNLGRPGGQTIIGATGSGEHLTLQSTSHATRGYVRAQDDLQLLSNIIRDSGGTARLTLATSSPHIGVTGDLDITGHSAMGNGATVSAGYALRAVETLDTHPCAAGHFEIHGDRATGPQFSYGIAGSASGEGGTGPNFVYGLYFAAFHKSSGTTSSLGAIAVQLQSAVAGSGAITIARGFHLSAGYWAGSKPTTIRGLDIEEQGGAGTGTAEAIKALDQTATTARLLELGPAIPYLRVVGGAAPGAGNTNLYMSEGATPTLRRLQTKDGAAIGGGDLVCVLV